MFWCTEPCQYERTVPSEVSTLQMKYAMAGGRRMNRKPRMKSEKKLYRAIEKRLPNEK